MGSFQGCRARLAARLGSLFSGAALAGLAVLLPVPWRSSTWATPRTGGPDQVVAAAALAAAAVLVWGLLAWAAAVGGLVLLARLPGSAGQSAQRWLGRLWPGLARRVLVTTVGASVLSGAAASLSASLTPAGAPASLDAGVAAAAPSMARPQLPISPASTSISALPAPMPEPAISAARDPAGFLVLRLTAEPRTEDDTGPAPRGVAPVNAAGDRSSPPHDRLSAGTPPALRLHAPLLRAQSPRPIDLDWPGKPRSGTESDAAAAGSGVVVLRGDSLWSIAARHLGADATDIQIDTAWRAWYATNRDVVGPDPDLILPGQILTPPAHLKETQ